MPDASTPDAPSLPSAAIEHRLPGRLRLRLHGRRGDAAFFARTAQVLGGVAGVRTVRSNPATGSLLVEHGGDEAAFLGAAREWGLFAAAPPCRDVAPRAAPARAGAAVAPLNLAAAGLAGAGLLQLARGQALGSASENLWNAYGLYIVTRRPWMSAFLTAFGLVQILRGEVLGSAVSLFLYAYSARRMAEQRRGEDTI